MAPQAEDRVEEPPFPWVSALIIGGSILLFALELFALTKWPPRTDADHVAMKLKFGALFVPAVRDGQWWRLASYAFVHGDMVHLGVNMLFTLGIGVPLERRISTVRFAQLSLVSCLGSAALVTLLSKPGSFTVGASGMALGWAGAMLFLVARRQKQMLLRMLFLNALISLMPGISWQGHLGGFVFGVAAGFLLRADPEKFSARMPFLTAAAAGLALWGAYR